MASEIKHRFSGLQKDILLVVQLMTERNNGQPVPFSAIYQILNRGRGKDVQKPNLRISCKTLITRNLLMKYRSNLDLTVAYRLSDEGLDAVAYLQTRSK